MAKRLTPKLCNFFSLLNIRLNPEIHNSGKSYVVVNFSTIDQQPSLLKFYLEADAKV